MICSDHVPPIDMKAMVLGAGFGRRLHPLTAHVPKPLILLHGKPVLDYTFAHLRDFGIRSAVMNTHHLADQLDAYAKTCARKFGIDVTISFEPQILETGGGIAYALPHFNNQPFLCVNGDIWWAEDHATLQSPLQSGVRFPSLLQRLLATWNPLTMDALLVLIPRDHAMGYCGPGDYDCTTTGQLIFRDQLLVPEGEARTGDITAPYVYGGIQILHPRLFERCDASRKTAPFSIVHLYHHAEKEKRLHGLIHKGLWCDMGSHEALALLQNHLGRLLSC